MATAAREKAARRGAGAGDLLLGGAEPKSVRTSSRGAAWPLPRRCAAIFPAATQVCARVRGRRAAPGAMEAGAAAAPARPRTASWRVCGTTCGATRCAPRAAPSCSTRCSRTRQHTATGWCRRPAAASRCRAAARSRVAHGLARLAARPRHGAEARMTGEALRGGVQHGCLLSRDGAGAVGRVARWDG